MSTTDQTGVRGDRNVWHTVGNIQHLKALVGLKYRPLCGVQLQLDPDAQYPTDDAPRCAACVAKAGG